MTTSRTMKPSQLDTNLAQIMQTRYRIERTIEKELQSLYVAFGVVPSDLTLEVMDVSTAQGADYRFSVRLKIEL